MARQESSAPKTSQPQLMETENLQGPTMTSAAPTATTAAQQSTGPSNGEKPKTEIQAFAFQLEQVRPKIALTLPSQIKPEAFERVILTAINMQPALLGADRRSLFNACHKAAQDGLLPDGREGALVIFGKQVVWMPMTYGIIKKLRQSGEIAAVSARVVYANELAQGKFTFIIEDGQEKLRHEPILTGERGEPALVYASVRFKDGTVQHEPLTMTDIEKIRKVSRAARSGPWVDWLEEMMRKSAVRRLSKYLPLSAEDRRTVERDDELTDFEVQKHAAIQNIDTATVLLGAPDEETSQTSQPAPEPTETAR